MKWHSHSPLLRLQFPFKRSNTVSETVEAIVRDNYEENAIRAAAPCHGSGNGSCRALALSTVESGIWQLFLIHPRKNLMLQ
jgi:hypothetical protein